MDTSGDTVALSSMFLFSTLVMDALVLCQLSCDSSRMRAYCRMMPRILTHSGPTQVAFPRFTKIGAQLYPI
jgi:hypothetical protein